MLGSLFSWLLIPAAIAFGWALARKGFGAGSPNADSFRKEAIAGLSGLISDNADQAVAALNRAIEAEPGAIELRLTLGGLFRKKGEVDRAILVHEALLPQPGLSVEQLAQVRLALAQDYLKAGVLDRAEVHAQSLVDHGLEVVAALELLIDLYEQGRDWQRAVQTALQWQSVKGQAANLRLGQYYCELADKNLSGRNRSEAQLSDGRQWLEKALATDANCVRASLMLGKLEEAQQNPSAAFDAYVQVLVQAPAFLPECLAAIQRCAVASARMADYEEWLEMADQSAQRPQGVVLARARWLKESRSDQDAASYLADCARTDLGAEGLLLWLELSGTVQGSDANWTTIRPLLVKKALRGPKYRCGHCGFSPSLLFWQCPSCKSWSNIKPNEG